MTSTGLAAKDGNLQEGDIILKVSTHIFPITSHNISSNLNSSNAEVSKYVFKEAENIKKSVDSQQFTNMLHADNHSSPGKMMLSADKAESIIIPGKKKNPANPGIFN